MTIIYLNPICTNVQYKLERTHMWTHMWTVSLDIAKTQPYFVLLKLLNLVPVYYTLDMTKTMIHRSKFAWTWQGILTLFYRAACFKGSVNTILNNDMDRVGETRITFYSQRRLEKTRIMAILVVAGQDRSMGLLSSSSSSGSGCIVAIVVN